MKIKEIENSKISKIVKYFVPEKIIKENFIIAGGFASWLLYLYKNDALDEVCEALYKFGSDSVKLKFGDIDIWIPKDSDFNFSEIMKNEKISLSDAEIRKNQTIFYNYFKHKVSLKKISKYAYTYSLDDSLENKNSSFINKIIKAFLERKVSVSSKKIFFQFMRKSVSGIEEIFSTFDMYHNMVAFYNNKLYVSEEAEKSFDDKIIYPTKFFIELDDSISITCACRAFKYNERYGFEFSDKLGEKITSLYSKIGLEDENEKINNLILSEMSEDDNDLSYNLLYLEINDKNLEKVKEIYLKKFIGYYYTFAEMKSFDSKYISLLLLSNINTIRNRTEELLYGRYS